MLPSLNGEAASLAVAIANPAIGIGSLIAQWMFKDQISSILSSEYSIAGPIDDPIVKKVESFGTRVERLEDRAKGRRLKELYASKRTRISEKPLPRFV